jgi:hypothetical protein
MLRPYLASGKGPPTRIAREKRLYVRLTYWLNQKTPKTKPCNWKPPDPGWHSLCVDASFLPDKNTGAWRAIIRDDKGSTIVSAWDFIPFCDNAEAAESIACLEGTKLALSSVHSGLVVQSDCASLIKKLSSQERDRSSTASIVLDIKEVL